MARLRIERCGRKPALSGNEERFLAGEAAYRHIARASSWVASFRR